MPEIILSISDPVSAVLQIVGQVTAKALDYAVKHRETMSQENRDEYDKLLLAALRRWDKIGEKIAEALGLQEEKSHLIDHSKPIRAIPAIDLNIR